MKIQLSIIWVLLFAMMATIGWQMYDKPEPLRLGYINISEVFNKFNLKTELEKDFLKTKSQRDRILDSLSVELQNMSNELNKESKPEKEKIMEFELRKTEFFKLKEQFENENKILSEKYDQQILLQLNQYVQEYGRQNNYICILGNDGNGSVMYAREGDDLTQEIVEYLNQKYENK